MSSEEEIENREFLKKEHNYVCISEEETDQRFFFLFVGWSRCNSSNVTSCNVSVVWAVKTKERRLLSSNLNLNS